MNLGEIRRILNFRGRARNLRGNHFLIFPRLSEPKLSLNLYFKWNLSHLKFWSQLCFSKHCDGQLWPWISLDSAGQWSWGFLHRNPNFLNYFLVWKPKEIYLFRLLTCNQVGRKKSNPSHCEVWQLHNQVVALSVLYTQLR